MTSASPPMPAGGEPAVAVLDDAVTFSLQELAHGSGGQVAWLLELVAEGVLEPLAGDDAQPASTGADPAWRFQATALRRACTAWRLARDLELTLPGVALALDLLDEIERLRQQLAQAGR